MTAFQMMNEKYHAEEMIEAFSQVDTGMYANMPYLPLKPGMETRNV